MNGIRDLTNIPSAKNKIEKTPNIEQPQFRLGHASSKWMLGWPEEWSETKLLDYLKNAFFWDNIQWILGSKDESQAYVSFFTYETLTDMRKIGLPLKRSKAIRRSDLLRVHLKLGASYKLLYWVRGECGWGYDRREKGEEFLGKRNSSENFEDEDEDCECPCGCGQIIKPLTNKKLKTVSFDLGTQNIANAIGEIKEELKEPKILSESENNAIDINFTERKTEEARADDIELKKGDDFDGFSNHEESVGEKTTDILVFKEPLLEMKTEGITKDFEEILLSLTERTINYSKRIKEILAEK